MELFEFKASPVSILNSRLARAVKRFCLKKQTKEKPQKQNINKHLNYSNPRKAIANLMKFYTHVIRS